MPHPRQEFHVSKDSLSDIITRHGLVDVYVESARSPDLIVLQRADLMENFKKLEKNIAAMYEEVDHRYPDKPNPKELKKTFCYAIYSSRKRRWARAKVYDDVQDVTNHKSTIIYHLVDYAVDEWLYPNRARHLPDVYCELPAMGYAACFTDPYLPMKTWTVLDISTFRDAMLGKNLRCKVLKEHELKEIYMVRMFCKPGEITTRVLRRDAGPWAVAIGYPDPEVPGDGAAGRNVWTNDAVAAGDVMALLP